MLIAGNATDSRPLPHPIKTTAAEQRGVRSVDDRVDALTGEITTDDLDRGGADRDLYRGRLHLALGAAQTRPLCGAGGTKIMRARDWMCPAEVAIPISDGETVLVRPGPGPGPGPDPRDRHPSGAC